MEERLACGDCGAEVLASAERCTACGSQRVQAQPDFFAKRRVFGGALVLAGVTVLLLTLVALAIPISLLASNGINIPSTDGRRERSLERQLDLLREAERTIPIYPGSARIREDHGTIAKGRARTLAVCWSAPADFESVRHHVMDFLTERESGWQPLGGSTRVFKRGRVYLTLTAPELARPACSGTYQLSFSYQV